MLESEAQTKDLIQKCMRANIFLIFISCLDPDLVHCTNNMNGIFFNCTFFHFPESGMDLWTEM